MSEMERRRGRPREVDDPVRVCVRVSAQDYDRLDRVARDRGTSVPAIIRQAAISALQNTTHGKASP
jgi:hypothetical protein